MPIHEYELFLRMGAAIALGGAIGFERELHEQPAGLRTHILVSLASATFILISAHFVFFQHYTNDGIVRADVGRIAANVVVGIGFLGGGAILHSGLQIKGLTTAASLWLVAAIGLASGAGMYLLAATVTLLALFALEVLRKLIEAPRKRVIQFRVRMDMEGEFMSRIGLAEDLRSIGATLTKVGYTRNLTNNRSRLDAEIRLPTEDLEEMLVKRLEMLPGMRRVRVERPEQ
ncbi:MAG TPA: MgtC/SapB family protein [Isosphaeraceae bacterium]|nr:MgtC/SapB family protein [Isosphaeraceae bacterium]